MKIILSRKGFDSEAGGYPSPILPDGTLLSIPIPIAGKNHISYARLNASTKYSYYHVMAQLSPRIKIRNWKRLTPKTRCHLDPDIFKSTYERKPRWRGLFGPDVAAQTHLKNQDVKGGDLFLFFGLFRKTLLRNGSFIFDPSSKSIQIIYGYLEIGRIHTVSSMEQIPPWMKYHPHAVVKNTIYESSKYFSLNPKFPGYGRFKYEASLVLSKPGYNKSQWQLPRFFKDVTISYHPRGSNYGWKRNYFQSAARGQEFVVEENRDVTKWARSIIEKSSQ